MWPSPRSSGPLSADWSASSAAAVCSTKDGLHIWREKGAEEWKAGVEEIAKYLDSLRGRVNGDRCTREAQ